MAKAKHWVGTWATTPAPSVAGQILSNHTVRMTPRVSLGGDTIRVRISNAYGSGNLVIGASTVGLRAEGSAAVQGTLCELTFGGTREAIVPAGDYIVSDPVKLDVAPLADLVVSVYLPQDILTDFQITGRYARQTNYISPPGDFSAETVMPVGKLTDEWFFVSGVDVLAAPETGGIVALGDSLTDANISTHDTYSRWPDQLARRLVARESGREFGVMNQGLGGNRILYDLRGDSGLRRFDRDVLAQPGVTHVVVMLGTNDLRNRPGLQEQEGNAGRMIAGLMQMALRAQTCGIKLIAATLTPFGNETFMANAWNPEREKHRVAFNRWIRETDMLDGVADFDAALRDPENSLVMLPNYDCGDGLHPSDLGYCVMGDAIDLALFD
ncbi:MAG: SGNH/GDSL hydrolase family protein [Pseudomonadota bacterium]|nr:SGNH/GDSL hydrolase family protein [Pseudomonadota bacterium]